MKGNYRRAGYFVAAALLIGLMSMGQRAWATPSQTHRIQTIPTRTPVPGITLLPPTAASTLPAPSTMTPVVPATMTPAAPSTTMPQPTAESMTPQPGLTSTVPTPAGTAQPVAGALGLAVAVDRSQVWPGATATFSVTVVNLTANVLRDLVIADVLPLELEPGEILSGAGAVWQDRTLRAEKTDLAPGEQYRVVFRAVVSGRAPAGAMVVNWVTASATGASEVTAGAAVAMPPAELPQVGGS